MTMAQNFPIRHVDVSQLSSVERPLHRLQPGREAAAALARNLIELPSKLSNEQVVDGRKAPAGPGESGARREL